MPSLTSLPLSLSDVLEARGGPLRELEIWAFLCQCAESLQDLIIKGSKIGEDGFRFMVTPNSLMVRDNGTVLLSESAQSSQGSLYVAPELEMNNGHIVSDTAFEKMFVFSLGRTLQVASEFGLKENEVLSISYDLDSLLQAMSERNAAVRMGLMHILEACALQAGQHPDKPPHTHTLSRLYKSVLTNGTKASFNDSSYGSDRSHRSTVETRPGRARKPRPQMRHRRADNSASWSRSRSRSRSRSLSRGRDHGHEFDSSFPWAKQEESQVWSGQRRALSPSLPVTVSSSHLLNTSMTSSVSDHSDMGAKLSQAPPYLAAHSVQGLLGLRQGSPAYQKYIQLKERQIRLRQARSGQNSALGDVRSRLMSPSLPSHEVVDGVPENRSMASLMSYTLGTYMPELHAQFGSEAALDMSKGTETDNESLMNSQLSLLFNPAAALRAPAEEVPFATAAATTTAASAATTAARAQAAAPQNKSRHEKSEDIEQIGRPVPLSRPEPVIRQREYYGPEFVHMLKKPVIKVAMPLQGDSIKNAAHARKVTVVHLTGQKIELVLDPSTTGRQVYDTIIPYADLDDFFFFGLTYLCEGEHFFLDADTKLHKVAPDGWKEGPKGHNIPFTLYVRVKFYPDSLADFRHTSSYHLLYLQLRRDVAEERVICDPEALSRLAGLALQVEYGDFNSETMGENYFAPEHYFSSRAVRRLGSSVVFSKAAQEHKACAGIGGSQAEIEFIKHVRHTPEYGIHFYKLFKSKSHTDQHIWVGLTQRSLLLAAVEGQGRNIVQDHPWNSILKISFNKRRFSIQPKVEVAKGKPPKINLYTNSYRKGRYLLQFSTEQHRFQIRMRTRPSNMETMSGDMSLGLSMPTVDTGVGEDTVEDTIASPVYIDPCLQALPDDEDEDDDDDGYFNGSSAHQMELPLQYHSPPPYQPPRMAQLLGGSHVFPELNDLPLHASLADLTGPALDQQQLKLLLDLSSSPTGQGSALANERREQDGGLEDRTPEDTSNKFKPSNSAMGRHVFEAVLQKEGKQGIGLTIVGGEATNSLDLGIFVKSLVPGGPADRDGRIKPGDRLIAIGGVSLEGKQHHEAVALIRDGGPQISMLVSQIRPPGTIKRSDQDARADFEMKLRHSMLEYQSNKRGPKNLFFQEAVNAADADNGTETFLTFDDFVQQSRQPHNNGIVNASNDACTSDEENYQLQPPSTPPPPLLPSEPPPALPSSPPPTQRYMSASPFSGSILPGNQDFDPDEGTAYTSYAPDPWSSGLHPLSGDAVGGKVPMYGSGLADSKEAPNFEEALMRLREDQELSFPITKEGSEWSMAPHEASRGFSESGLTAEEREGLHLLGDIAALEADGSSSDSDFETAVKNTVEGSRTSVSSGKAVNTVNPLVIKRPQNLSLREVNTSRHPAFDDAVTYEVLLEKRNGTLGIIPEAVHSSEFPDGTVCIKDIVPGSSAEQGGILAPGDRLMEVGGENSEHLSVEEAEHLLHSAPELCTVKVSRSSQMDALITQQHRARIQNEMEEERPSPAPPSDPMNPREKKRTNPPEAPMVQSSQQGNNSVPPMSQLMSLSPQVRTEPLGENLVIVPPPPPLKLTTEESESNTQSDVDSDVLDSSRSELEGIYKSAELYLGDDPGQTPRVAPEDVGGEDIEAIASKNKKAHKKTPENCIDNKNEGNDDNNNQNDAGSKAMTEPQLDVSSEFDENLAELKNDLDKLAAEKVSPSNLSRSSGSSSTDSVVRSPRKLIEERQRSLLGQSKPESEGEERKEAGTRRGDEDRKEGRRTLEAPARSGQDVSRGLVQEKLKMLEGQDVKEEEDAFKPQLMEVKLKRKEGGGFGFTVAGGVNTGGCYVKQLVSGPAAADGRIRPGDKILQVNGTDTSSMSHFEAVSLLRKTAQEVTLQLLRYPSSAESHQRLMELQDRSSPKEKLKTKSEMSTSQRASSPAESKDSAKGTDTPKAIIKPYGYSKSPSHWKEEDTEDEAVPDAVGRTQPQSAGVLRIELTKPDQSHASLGISVMEKEKDGQRGVYVQRLKVGGIAHSSGQLRPGDRLLQVNGVSLIGLDSRRVVQILREADDHVLLTVSRSNESTENEGEVASESDEDSGDEDISSLAEEACGYLKKHLAEEAGSESAVPLPYSSPRMLSLDIPVILSDEWLRDLPLMMTPSYRDKAYSSDVLGSLADMVEGGEPYEEFKNLRQMKELEDCETGKLPENKAKNRYRNVLPYDTNRVHLRNKTNDYINASRIHMSVGEDSLHYIVCQGPTSECFEDLWAMLWQEHVAVVVMLTKVLEAGKVKCHQYWPHSKDQDFLVDDRTLCVKLLRSYEVEEFTVNQFTLQVTASGEQRELTQLLYTAWPDHGAPDTALPLLKLLQVMHLLEQGRPPVIHCSAGIGRSGALIAVDVALATIEKRLKVDIFDIVHKLRTQRHGMIQTTDQYLFCYTACMEALLGVEMASS